MTDRATLLGFLAAQRASVLAILDGWDEAGLRRSPLDLGRELDGGSTGLGPR